MFLLLPFYPFTFGVSVMNLDSPCRCSRCLEPMSVWVSILVCPGDDSLDLDKIDWSRTGDPSKWSCPKCHDDGKLPLSTQQFNTVLVQADKLIRNGDSDVLSLLDDDEAMRTFSVAKNV